MKNKNGIVIGRAAVRAAMYFMAAIMTLVMFWPPPKAEAAAIVAEAVYIEGDVKAVLVKDNRTVTAVVGDTFAEGDRLFTGRGSAVEIELDTGDRIRMGESTDMVIRSLGRDETGSTFAIFNLALGKVRSFVSKLAGADSRFEYHTRSAVTGVAGTDFVVEVPNQQTTIAYVLPKHGAGAERAEEDVDLTQATICRDQALWEQGKIYVRGFDADETTVFLTSCFMTTVRFGQAPGEPRLLPDGMLIGSRANLPFMVPLTGVEEPIAERDIQTATMMENIARRVSVPPIAVAPDSVFDQDTQFDQGQGLSATGGPNASTPSDVFGTGTANISVSQ